MDAVDEEAVVDFDDPADELLLSAADDELTVDLGALGPRAACPVAFFADPEFEVAELEESDADP
ncbi:hypothetical protein ACTXG7_03320 [Mycolicibacterium sp. Dal123E01]|uniref:hypothetical protein n=1 Tax=Mycolicibacterium sp. Dal123E01 TaxID=3457578 RepID=UPI00403E9EFB